jgi:hypothetical protein
MLPRKRAPAVLSEQALQKNRVERLDDVLVDAGFGRYQPKNAFKRSSTSWGASSAR